jgi:3-deoxy-D-manno-octulosonic-acid transferase
LGEAFRQRFGNRPVFLCASTREGEEALILDAWLKVGAASSGRFRPYGLPAGGMKCPVAGTALLVVVPRHPQRFDEVARLIEARGLKFQRRSDEQPVAADTHAWLGDSMGEMFAYYAAANVAFVGGSLLDFGCQNLIEPCAVGTPVLVGPSTFNFAEAARTAIAAGAAAQVQNADELVSAANALLSDSGKCQGMGETGCAFAAQHRGATQRTMELIGRFIPAAR